MTSIGDYAFYECDALTSVAIPAGVTYFDDEAFGSLAMWRNRSEIWRFLVSWMDIR